jgi:hypothetical protein
VLVAQRIGDLVPRRERLGLGLLREDRPDHRRHRGTLLGADVGQQAASPSSAVRSIRRHRRGRQQPAEAP